jgi:hypothetical protein
VQLKRSGVKRGLRQPENLFGIYDFWFWHAMILCWNLCASNFNDFHLPEINGKYDNSANCDSLDGSLTPNEISNRIAYRRVVVLGT